MDIFLQWFKQQLWHIRRGLNRVGFTENFLFFVVLLWTIAVVEQIRHTVALHEEEHPMFGSCIALFDVNTFDLHVSTLSIHGEYLGKLDLTNETLKRGKNIGSYSYWLSFVFSWIVTIAASPPFCTLLQLLYSTVSYSFPVDFKRSRVTVVDTSPASLVYGSHYEIRCIQIELDCSTGLFGPSGLGDIFCDSNLLSGKVIQRKYSVHS